MGEYNVCSKSTYLIKDSRLDSSFGIYTHICHLQRIGKYKICSWPDFRFGYVLRMFLIFVLFQPRRSYKNDSYKIERTLL